MILHDLASTAGVINLRFTVFTVPLSRSQLSKPGRGQTMSEQTEIYRRRNILTEFQDENATRS